MLSTLASRCGQRRPVSIAPAKGLATKARIKALFGAAEVECLRRRPNQSSFQPGGRWPGASYPLRNNTHWAGGRRGSEHSLAGRQSLPAGYHVNLPPSKAGDSRQNSPLHFVELIRPVTVRDSARAEDERNEGEVARAERAGSRVKLDGTYGKPGHRRQRYSTRR